MPVMTVSEVETLWKAIVDVAEDIRNFAEVASPSVDSLLETAEAAIVSGRYPANVSAALQGIRARYGASMPIQDALGWVAREYGAAVGDPNTDPRVLWGRVIYDYFADNAKTVRSRGMTRPAPTMGVGNTGDGEIFRLTVDKNGHTIESGVAEALAYEVVRDGNNAGTLPGQEIWRLTGAVGPSNNFGRLAGSGLEVDFASITHRNGGVLPNGSFELGMPSSDGALTAMPTSWTLSSGTVGNLQRVSTPYRSLTGETGLALRFTANNNATIRCNLQANNVKLSPATPWFLGLAIKPATGLTAGTLTIGLGDRTRAITLSSLTLNAYNFEELTLGQNTCWYDNFALGVSNAPLAVTIQLASHDANVDIDEVILAPMSFLGDGTYHVAVGGGTNWERADTAAATDTETGSGTGKLQYQLAMNYGTYLPHSGTPTVTDP